MVENSSEVSLTEAAHQLGISWERAWRLVLTGQLEGKKERGKWVIHADSLRELIKARPGTA